MKDLKLYIQRSLDSYSSDEAEALSIYILQEAFGFSRARLHSNKITKLSPFQESYLKEILQRLSRHEPIQHILGKCYFYDLTFEVNSNVLIPRPETEELVFWILEDYKNQQPKILDIGTGSGCIAITLAKKLSDSKVSAWDISEKALETAKINAGSNHVDVQFKHVDILNFNHNCEEKFDIIVSNPPYICSSEKKDMERNVLDFEPATALFVKDVNPLIFYEKISEFALESLSSNGSLYFEINRRMGEEMKEMLKNKGFSKIELRKDISQNNRMIKAQL